jgi:hypothetical protein
MESLLSAASSLGIKKRCLQRISAGGAVRPFRSHVVLLVVADNADRTTHRSQSGFGCGQDGCRLYSFTGCGAQFGTTFV